MKKVIIFLLVPLFFACTVDPPEPIADYETVIAELQAQIDELENQEETNEPPVIEISPDGQTVNNGQTATFTVDVLDSDDIEFAYIWAVDGIVKSEIDTLSFLDTPEFQTDYIIALTVSDGRNLVSDSVTLTVLKPAWQPTILHIYIFAEGVELSDETAAKDYTATDADAYPALLNAAKLKRDSMNLEGTGVYYIIEGGT